VFGRFGSAPVHMDSFILCCSFGAAEVMDSFFSSLCPHGFVHSPFVHSIRAQSISFKVSFFTHTGSGRHLMNLADGSWDERRSTTTLCYRCEDDWRMWWHDGYRGWRQYVQRRRRGALAPSTFRDLIFFLW
jgi:hypothetical protein